MENEETVSLQQKKLTLEIAELERPWWKRPPYILAALPTLLAVVALSVGFLNGYFSAQLTKLENQKHDLETQISGFEGTRKNLVSQNEQLQQDMSNNRKKIIQITSLVRRLEGILVELRNLGSVPSGEYRSNHERALEMQRNEVIQELIDLASGN